jgi:hypothetical protein
MRQYNVDKDTLIGLYEITNDGHIYRRKDGKEYLSSTDTKGYLRVRIPYPNANSKDGRYTFKVHRLVAMLYVDGYSDELQVNHKNGVKTDNRAENLEMVTNKENALHAWRILDSTKRRQIMSEIMSKRNKRRYENRNQIDNTQLRLF